jgi:hypothetical protein
MGPSLSSPRVSFGPASHEPGVIYLGLAPGSSPVLGSEAAIHPFDASRAHATRVSQARSSLRRLRSSAERGRRPVRSARSARLVDRFPTERPELPATAIGAEHQDVSLLLLLVALTGEVGTPPSRERIALGAALDTAKERPDVSHPGYALPRCRSG